MRRPNGLRRISIVSAALLFAISTLGAGAVQAIDPPAIQVENGVTQPVFGYADAIRERVWVDAGFDSDRDGIDDVIAADIIRPAATADGLKVPVIIDNSPYYSTLCRGNEAECKRDLDGDGLLDRWPLFYDNYFVPRGYAIVLIDMTGTNLSTGCPTIQGTTENLSGPVVIDWLNGRRTARDKDGNVVTVDWHNGKSAMIGKSYDGALAMAAAVTGVEGLATVVPIEGPYNYYDYTRSNGIVMRGNNYLRSLATTITNDNPARQARCNPIWSEIDAADGDQHGDYTPFWAERDYLKDADKIKASVFLVHGIQDENVRPDHTSKFWYRLTELDIPRKMWIGRIGHVEPFDFRRAAWVDTLHRWFDRWLHGIDNGIEAEPKVDLERSIGVWEQHTDWPIPGTQMLDLHLRAGTATNTNGRLGISAAATPATTSFNDSTSQSEATMINNPTSVTASRRVFLSDPLVAPVHLSGTPIVRLRASANRTDTNVGAIIVDYGPSTQNNRTGEGILQTTLPEECYGLASATDDGCYRPIAYRPQNVTQWRVTKGILDALNRNSIEVPEPLVPGQAYDFTFPMLPEDFVFPAGHRIGVVIVGSYPGYSSQADTSGATITLDLQRSKISLPIVGGYGAAVASGGFLPDTTPPSITVSDDIVTEATGPLTPVPYPAPVATDAEDPAPTADCDVASGSFLPVGETVVICTARDGSGNTSQASFTITVTDTTPPVLTLPDPIAIDATSPAGAVVEYVVTATDIADPSPAVGCEPPSGSTFPIGGTTVECSAVDASGNEAVGSFEVHVRGAAEQLARLRAAVTGVGPGSALADKVADMEADLAAGNVRAVCNQLGRSFPRAVLAQVGLTISAAEAEAILADATRIGAVIGC